MNKNDIRSLKPISKSSNTVISLMVAILGVFITTLGIVIFYRYMFMGFPLGVRMVLGLVTQWAIMLVPSILMIINKDKLSDFGITTKNIPRQILIGVILALIMSFVLTVIPILLGFKEMVGNTSYTKPWQFVYELVYLVFGVAVAEEFVFRGYIFYKLQEIKVSRKFAIIVSSILFGFFHIFNGNLIQVIVTGFIGFMFCVFREKIRSCTLLSLIVLHGLYDWLIVFWVAVL